MKVTLFWEILCKYSRRDPSIPTQ